MPIEEIKASFPEKGNMFYQKNSILLLSGPQALHQVCEVLLNNFLKNYYNIAKVIKYS